MILIAAVDDRFGMTFNHRRQSKDCTLRQDILSMTEGNRLWMDQYTAGQFEQPLAPQIIVDDDYILKAGTGDYCFLERSHSSIEGNSLEQIILYHWNRAYPGDVHFGITLPSPNWILVHTEDFKGNSHEKITKEVWNYVSTQ